MLERLLDYLEEIRQRDEKEDRARDEYFKIMYPDSYPPYRDGFLDTALKTVELFNPLLSDELSYYFYDARNIEKPIVTREEKEYNFKERSEFLRYCKDFEINLK